MFFKIQFLQLGGITVRFDPAQPAGARVLSVQKDGQDLLLSSGAGSICLVRKNKG